MNRGVLRRIIVRLDRPKLQGARHDSSSGAQRSWNDLHQRAEEVNLMLDKCMDTPGHSAHRS
jgi:hypothetical protein